MKRIIILEDDLLFAQSLMEHLEIAGYDVMITESCNSFLDKYQQFNPDLLILDINLANSRYNGLETLKMIKENTGFDAKVLVISGEMKDQYIEEALRLGAYNFIEKGAGLNIEKILVDIKQALAHRDQERISLTLQKQKHNLREKLLENIPFIGEDPRIIKANVDADTYAATDRDAFIIGQTGTGKTTLSNRIYHLSSRFGNHLQILRLSSLTPAMQKEFFAPDSFYASAFYRAAKGFIILDELQHLTYDGQGLLLDILEKKEAGLWQYDNIKIDCSFVFMTSNQIYPMVEHHLFRRDLFLFLEQNKIELPSLLDRGHDIALLMEYFFIQLLSNFENILTYELDDILPELMSYNWPGNVRELKNFCSYISGENKEVSNKAILDYLQRKKRKVLDIDYSSICQRLFAIPTLPEATDNFEKEFLSYHLKLNNNRKGVTARAVGIERTTLYKKMNRYGLDTNSGDD